uniref:AC4 protein n=1 Tax=Tomato mottle wrinkle virus TaxID=1266458 RepID=A0A097H1E0_9GEMI|nr:AC4 protein [Tomato mottle wrinkle virus]AIT42280.1 AC4 protein [Tomato mottle wrinkle virus]AIT42286.1 AC4 protein [Tomato mottle wrinkle virus]
MGSLISMCLSNSKVNTNARIIDSSTWYPQQDQHISIRTFRELNHRPTSSPISIKTEILLNGENSKSTVEVLEEVSKRLTTPQQRH